VCITGYTKCQGQCVNLDWDNRHCGTCGKQCQDGEVCSQGSCISGTTCEDLGLTTCDGVCANLANDPGNCGECGHACNPGQNCIDGFCTGGESCADQGLVDCQGQCVDLNSDSANCGECGHFCSGFPCCQGLCVNLNNDILNCGSCGHDCPADKPFCDQGQCATPPCADDVYCGAEQTCCDINCCNPDQLCCTVPGPVGSTTQCTESGAETCPTGCVECVCLSPETPIATPQGYRPIASLRIGDLVYSVHHWSVQAVPLAATRRTPVSQHRVLRVRFDNGAVIEVSRGHPTADGRIFGDLHAGQRIGDVGIQSIAVLEYRHSYTWDILPDSDTGSYFAAGVRIGSTISSNRGQTCSDPGSSSR